MPSSKDTSWALMASLKAWTNALFAAVVAWAWTPRAGSSRTPATNADSDNTSRRRASPGRISLLLSRGYTVCSLDRQTVKLFGEGVNESPPLPLEAAAGNGAGYPAADHHRRPGPA